MKTNIDTAVGQLVSWQVLLIAIAAGLAWWQGWPELAKAVGFGGGIAIGNTFLLGVRVQRMEEHPGHLVQGAIQRFVFTLACLALAFAWLELGLLGVVIGMVAGHVAWLLYALNYWQLQGRKSGGE